MQYKNRLRWRTVIVLPASCPPPPQYGGYYGELQTSQANALLVHDPCADPGIFVGGVQVDLTKALLLQITEDRFSQSRSNCYMCHLTMTHIRKQDAKFDFRETEL